MKPWSSFSAPFVFSLNTPAPATIWLTPLQPKASLKRPPRVFGACWPAIRGNAGQHAPKTRGGLFKLALGCKGVSQIVAGAGVFRLNTKGALKLLQGFIDPALRLQRGAKIVQGLRLLRL